MSGSGQIAQHTAFDKDFNWGEWEHIPINRKMMGTHYGNYRSYRGGGQMQNIVHTTLACPRANTLEADPMPVFEEDGELFAYYRGYIGRVRLCTQCPDMDTEWMTEAACDGASMPFDDPEASEQFIATLCDNCPVVLACLDMGIAQYPDSHGSVWGGVYFTMSKKKREKAIEHRRLREEQRL